jgi:acetylglutamate kinase
VIVFKYGGHAISQSGGIDPVIVFLASRIKNGEKIVLVHGGGPQINRELEIHGIKTEMVNGLRKTSPEVFEVVQRTLSGEVLRNLTNQLIGQDINALGMSASDGELMRGEVTTPELGQVGEVSNVNPLILNTLFSQGITPVISPVCVTVKGQGLNMNADLIAGSLGGALQADVVMFSTDVPGIFRNWPDQDSFITSISVSELKEISKNFEGGMIPKAKAAINAIESGAKSVRVFDGRDVSTLKSAFAGDAGTLVVA